MGVATGPNGTFFISDTSNSRIRQVSSGIINTIFTTQFQQNGDPTALGFEPAGLSFDAAGVPGQLALDEPGVLLFSDLFSGGVNGYSTTTGQYFGGLPFLPLQYQTTDVATTANGIFVTIAGFNCVMEFTGSGVDEGFAAVAGTCAPQEGSYSGDGGLATSAHLSFPWSLAVDNAGNIFIADTGNNRVRKIDTNGIITTVAGDGSSGYSGDAVASQPTPV